MSRARTSHVGRGGAEGNRNPVADTPWVAFIERRWRPRHPSAPGQGTGPGATCRDQRLPSLTDFGERKPQRNHADQKGQNHLKRPHVTIIMLSLAVTSTMMFTACSTSTSSDVQQRQAAAAPDLDAPALPGLVDSPPEAPGDSLSDQSGTRRELAGELPSDQPAGNQESPSSSPSGAVPTLDSTFDYVFADPTQSAAPKLTFTNAITTDMRNRTGQDMTLQCTNPQQTLTIGNQSSTNVTGHSGTFDSADDISCSVTVDGGTSGKTSFPLTVKNPHFGLPTVTVGTHTDTLDVDDNWTVTTNFVQVNVSRWADNQFNGDKLFTFTFTTSRNKS